MKEKSASSIIHKEHINYKITLNIRRVKTINSSSKEEYHYNNKENGNFKRKIDREDH